MMKELAACSDTVCMRVHMWLLLSSVPMCNCWWEVNFLSDHEWQLNWHEQVRLCGMCHCVPLLCATVPRSSNCTYRIAFEVVLCTALNDTHECRGSWHFSWKCIERSVVKSACYVVKMTLHTRESSQTETLMEAACVVHTPQVMW